MNNKYDVIVVGAGHAGCEAALISAKMGVKTLLVTIKLEAIGRMSCNPSVGGPAKGHVAKEIDALGGAMAKVADITGIQFRMLNKSKGPAVWSPRSQNDRVQYSIKMREICENQENLLILEAIIDEIMVEDNEVKGVITNLGQTYFSPKVILANGTFLKGLVHVGKCSYSAGRAGELSSENLSSSMRKIGLNLARFKTGTPCRVDLRTLDYNYLSPQYGDENPEGFSLYSDLKLKNNVPCYLTHTNEKTHEIIRNNLHNSSLYSGQIKGVGPRYCPSIEDKVVKFSEKNAHQVFIEPEGENTFEGYVNGMSNSLPPYVQEEFIHSIKGLQKAKFMRYAYAIEYDYVLASEIKPTLETKKIKGLYLTGQINGTSGYEEAAAQGLMAGINASLSLDKKDPFILDRSQSYIGVLIDDLVTKGTSEPYRLFTSRAEYRLFLRQDNVDERLFPISHKLGLLSEEKYQKFLKVQEITEREMAYLSQKKSIKHPSLKEPVKLANVLKRPNVNFDDLSEYGYKIKDDITKLIKEKISIKIKYDGYLNRQLFDIKKFASMEKQSIPEGINFLEIPTIAYEAREKMQKIKPLSIGQAQRISGVNYSDIMALMIYLKKFE